MAIGALTVPVDDEVGKGLERGAVRLAVARRARAGRELELERAGRLDRAGRGDQLEGRVVPLAGERPPNALVLARGEDERQGRRAVAQVDSGRLAGRVEVAGAVEDVVGDLEGDAEREPERAQLRTPAAQDARGLEQLAGLQRAAGEVLVDGRIRPERLTPRPR